MWLGFPEQSILALLPAPSVIVKDQLSIILVLVSGLGVWFFVLCVLLFWCRFTRGIIVLH